MTLSKMTFSITTLSIKGSLNIAIAMLCHYADCRFAECCYAECHYAECRYAECRYAKCQYDEWRSTTIYIS